MITETVVNEKNNAEPAWTVTKQFLQTIFGDHLKMCIIIQPDSWLHRELEILIEQKENFVPSEYVQDFRKIMPRGFVTNWERAKAIKYMKNVIDKYDMIVAGRTDILMVLEDPTLWDSKRSTLNDKGKNPFFQNGNICSRLDGKHPSQFKVFSYYDEIIKAVKKKGVLPEKFGFSLSDYFLYMSPGAALEMAKLPDYNYLQYPNRRNKTGVKVCQHKRGIAIANISFVGFDCFIFSDEWIRVL